MNKEIKKLLTIMFKDDNLSDLWLNSHNNAFNMNPQEMIDIGREEEVINYLDFYVYGPY